MNFPSRLFLIGLPGSGKTTMGKELAKELAYTFIDLDDRIVFSAGKSIPEIFTQDGEERFREIERDELRKIVGERCVIATGGGAPCFHHNMDWMQENGFTVYLNPPLEIVAERVASDTNRPLISGEPLETLQHLLEKRKPFYQQAGMESDHLEPCELLVELRNFFTSS